MQQGGLGGKVALVTGAGRGIGRAIAVALAGEGIDLGLVSRTRRDLERTAELAGKHGAQALVCPADLIDPDVPGEVVERTAEHFGGLDILINNAGIAMRAPLAQTSVRDWDRHMALNARAPFLASREALCHLCSSEVATIINISSVVGVKGYMNQGAYTASKHALMGLSKVLAREVESEGIRVHTVCPGGVATPMVARTRPDLDAEDLMRPEDIANIITFLLKNREGRAVIDDIHVRRSASEPWF